MWDLRVWKRKIRRRSHFVSVKSEHIANSAISSRTANGGKGGTS